MAYFLRQDKKKNGIYLQVYESYWDKDLKESRNRSVKSFGYVHELISDEITDPVTHFKEVVNQMNEKRKAEFLDETRPRAFTKHLEKNVGYFLLSSLIDELGVKETVDILASAKQFQFSLFDMMAQLIYCRAICPCSKSKTVSSVFPKLFESSDISEDQVYDGLNFIGENYKKYIELFNHCLNQYYKRDYSRVFFDCTNYYFEIDISKDDKQKGVSKEKRNEPVIGQALLLDSDLIPLAMQMYPGNESEKPYIRKVIEEMKQRYKVTGKTVQVADKGLNCARNIYAAAIEGNDGYIFSKSIRGKNISQAEKKWVLLENSANVFEDFYNEDNSIKFRLKSCVDSFEYKFDEVDPETNKTVTRKFSVKERRIVSYNPSLAKKQRLEILKMVDKAKKHLSYKELTKEEIGEAAKYIKVNNKDSSGKKVNPVFEIDQAVIDEDMEYAGYNMIVTSELNMQPVEVYETYHNLWKIEESFRITKSMLDGRPVFVQKKETIYGHFLICYLCLFLLRVLEIKCFSNKVSSYDIINFIRDFRVVDKGDGTFINLSSNQYVNEKISSVTGIINLDALVLTKNEIDNLFNSSILINSEY
ncbi:MAG: IS1634 family transposase [Erysipelotrichaceae bacterium]|mgnify:CR=1 FL=1